MKDVNTFHRRGGSYTIEEMEADARKRQAAAEKKIADETAARTAKPAPAAKPAVAQGLTASPPSTPQTESKPAAQI